MSRVIRRCQPAVLVYRVWRKGMTGTYPTYELLKRVVLGVSSECPYCDAGVPETLTHFACVCPQFREAQTSAHNQVRKVISSYLIRWVGPKWTVHEETQMGNMGLTLSKVPATVVVDAGKSSGADAVGECDLQRWRQDWVAISYNMPTNELPSLTCVVHRMHMAISWKLLLLSSKVGIVPFSMHLTSILNRGGSSMSFLGW
jgi:hypothetical protein